jgi:hypothetical protein
MIVSHCYLYRFSYILTLFIYLVTHKKEKDNKNIILNVFSLFFIWLYISV